MRHHAHVVHLANLSVLFYLQYLIVDALLVNLHLGELSAEFLALLICLNLQLFIQLIFQIVVFVSHHLVLSHVNA